MANTKITSRVLADNAVLTANITDANVTTAKVADNAVTGDKVADDVALAGNPTTTTQSAGNNTTRIATTAFVSTAVADLADSAPDALNTLNELAAALGDDANFSTTITNSIAAKLPLAGGTMTGDLALADNVKAVFGAGSDLQIFSNGTSSYIIEGGSGNLEIRATDIFLKSADNTKALATFDADGAASISHNGSTKLTTTSTGIDVTGTATMDGLTVEKSGAIAATINRTTSSGATVAVQVVGSTVGTLGSDTGGNGRFDISSVAGGVSANALQISRSGGTPTAIFDSSGNVGIGVTPEAWHADWEVLRIGERAAFYSQASTTTGIAENVYYDSGWKAIATAAGSLYQQDAGNHHFYTMASVSADATSSPSEKFTILNSGNVGIGDANPADKLEINGLSAYPHIRITSSTNTSRYMRIGMEDATNHVIEANGTSTSLKFKTAGADRMVLNSTGKLSVTSTGAVAIDALGEGGSHGMVMGGNDGGFGYIGHRSSGSYDLKINSSGYVTTPQQPSFQALNPAVTNGGNVVVFGGVTHNVGADYSTSTGKFTAPVAGTYIFTFGILLDPASAGAYSRIIFRINNANRTNLGDTLESTDAGATEAYNSVSLTCIFVLAANDFVQVYNDGENPTYGTAYGSFSGHMLG